MIKGLYLFFLLILPCPVFSQDTIVNDQFSQRPFGVELSPVNIKKTIATKFTEEKKTITNKHTGEVDTLLIFKSNVGDFTFYRTADKTFFYKAVIRSRGIRLAKGIEIGNSKSSFMKTLGFSKSKGTDVFIVRDTIGYSKHKFFFKDDKLTKIELESAVD